MNTIQIDELKYIITSYLYNSKNLIETQRLKESWFRKHNLMYEWIKYSEFFSNHEEFFSFLITHLDFKSTSQKFNKNNHCPICNKNVKFRDINKGYYKFCSQSCAGKLNNIEKCKSTKKERYGNENYNNMKKCLTTKLEKYGDENYFNHEKARVTYSNRTIEEIELITEKRKKNMFRTLR